jgi:hypothetical protein
MSLKQTTRQVGMMSQIRSWATVRAVAGMMIHDGVFGGA